MKPFTAVCENPLISIIIIFIYPTKPPLSSIILFRFSREYYDKFHMIFQDFSMVAQVEWTVIPGEVHFSQPCHPMHIRHWAVLASEIL